MMESSPGMRRFGLWIFGAAVAVVFFGLLAFLLSVFEHKREARSTYVRVAEIRDDEPDPAEWGKNFPAEFDAYKRTMKTSELIDYSKFGRYGGSEAFSKLDRTPDMVRLFAGYPFSVEYREERGHLRGLEDMLATKRLGDAKPGTCMTCKSSQVPGIIKDIGPEKFYSTPVKELLSAFNIRFSISCADCHDAQSQALRVSRPALKEALAARSIDLGAATHTDMRSYACAQCHAEYYFQGPGKYLVFPWAKGLRVEDIESTHDAAGFKDWEHAETKAPLVKMQHPDYELWSSGIHARSGVSCPDCHMPYKKEGAMKVTDHWIRTPLANPTNACAGCHRLPEAELRARVIEIQDRTWELLTRAEKAIIGLQDAVIAAMKDGVPDGSLSEARALHRRAFLRWDFMSAENSMGFHSPQEAARILGDAIDLARQGEISALKAAGARAAAGIGANR
jgi:nitrite reductase (cytochrome c-552)